MKNIKIILKSSKEIFITYILNYLIIIVSGLIYSSLGYKDVDYFINNILIYILLVFYTLTSIYLYKKNYKKEKRLPIKDYFPLFYLGISLAVFLNMLIFLISPSNITTSPSLLIIISTGIIGPIYEEILYRYILYKRLNKKYTKKIAIIITTIIFAIMHISPIKIAYAFILGLILNIIYDKKNTILAPILIHVAANIIVIFLNQYNSQILILSLINLLLSIYLNFFKTNNKKFH